MLWCRAEGEEEVHTEKNHVARALQLEFNPPHQYSVRCCQHLTETLGGDGTFSLVLWIRCCVF
jgi:hypothetical protein